MHSRLQIIALSLLFLISGRGNISPNKFTNEPEENNSLLQLFNSKFQNEDFSYETFKLAYTGFEKMSSDHLLSNDSLLTIIDYSKPSDIERLYILDIKNMQVIEKSLVAHGMSSGSVLPEYFSNTVQSHKSSLGFYITGNTYIGKHGYSLRINGIEKGINDNARKRAIVFHGAKYVSQSYIDEYGRIGRSFGCPALPLEKNNKIIDLIKNRTCVFIYHPTSRYLSESKIIIHE